MERFYTEIDAYGLSRPGAVIRYGHFGRPVLAFPAEAGRAWDYEDHGMIAAIAPLIDAGRIKVYCVDSFDGETWGDRWASTEERARRHGHYQDWIGGPVAEFIGRDTPGAHDAVVTGVSLGAYHALQFALTRADLFPVAICQSGNYDPSSWHGHGDRGDRAYFTNPTDYVPGLHGGHLDWLRARLHLVLTVGQGPFETSPTQAIASSTHMAHLLWDKGINTELDMWGYDVAHDWPWWQRQLAHHLPRFC